MHACAHEMHVCGVGGMSCARALRFRQWRAEGVCAGPGCGDCGLLRMGGGVTLHSCRWGGVRVFEAFPAVPGAAGDISATRAACSQQSPLSGGPVQSLLSISFDECCSIHPYLLHFTMPRRRQTFTDANLSGLLVTCRGWKTVPADGRGACRSQATSWTLLRYVLL